MPKRKKTMAKFRTTGPDVHQHPENKRAAKPGKIGATKLGVYDRGANGELRLRGQVGALATSSTAARFHGKLGSTVQTVAGRKAWVAPDNIVGGYGSAQSSRAKAKLAAQLRGDKGSNK
jgi:hypothetical protein